MAAAQQVRLLLWKDYLIRKRKPITLTGIAWATSVLLSLYIVRINIDNIEYPTCQFAARALPSAGVLPFLQSFICNVNNECSATETNEEIPSYEKARFTQMYSQISPIINNSTILDVAAIVPDAVKILATLSDVADNPTFLNLIHKGLFVSDLFRNPNRAKEYLSEKLELPDEVLDSLMTSEIGIDGFFKDDIFSCGIESISGLLKMKNVEHLKLFVNTLCQLDKNVIQSMIKDLLLEMDLGKYIHMIGDMLFKLSGDDKLIKIGDMLTGLLRMTTIYSFLPPELSRIFNGEDVRFSYVNLTMIPQTVDTFRSTFGETESFKSIKEFADGTVVGVQYVDKIFGKDKVTSVVNNKKEKKKSPLSQIKNMIDQISDFINNIAADESFDFFNLLAQITKIIMKFLSDSDKHDFMFYTTLLAKLIDLTENVVDVNVNLDQRLYDTSIRNPQGIKVLLNLPLNVVVKGMEALADPERIQVLISKLDNPQDMFCDEEQIQSFFLISNEESIQLKTQLCTDTWKNYTYDLFSTFRIQDVKNNINSMASLFILEAFGKDISKKLYPIEKCFEYLKNFTNTLQRLDRADKPKLDWTKVLNVTKDSEFLKTVKSKAILGKHMLVTVHGAFAKEVIKQNPLLDYKIAPFIKDLLIFVEALHDQLNIVNADTVRNAKTFYPFIFQTLLATAKDKEKFYKSLSTSCDEMFCHGAEYASQFVNIPTNVDKENVTAVLCDLSNVIENGLKNNSIIAETIRNLTVIEHNALEEVDWTRLITSLNKLYEKAYTDYTYIFEYKSFGMDEALQKEVAIKLKEVVNYWFSLRNIGRSLHLLIKIMFRFLDILDHGAFDISDETWLKIKYGLNFVIGPEEVAHDLISLMANVLLDEEKHSNLPELTASMLRYIVPSVPRLMIDAADMITKHDVDIEPIVTIMNASPAWPCSTTSISDLLPFKNHSVKAVESIESLACFDRNLQIEWSNYLLEKKIPSMAKTWNDTVYPEKIFLKFSNAFDLFIEDMDSLKAIAEDAFYYDEDDDRLNFASAVEYFSEVVNNTSEETFRNFYYKTDKVLNGINTSIEPNATFISLWKKFVTCRDTEDYDQCRTFLRTSMKYTFEFLSIVVENFSQDLLMYFKEATGSNATLVQIFGFTSNTPLFMLYDKLPEFIAVLMNSYLDLGFMNQIRRASDSQFWDCHIVVKSLNPGPGSFINEDVIERVKPLICPSLFYWISTPVGANTLMDIIAKPQYFLFNKDISTFTSSFENAYIKTKNLTEYLKNTSLSNELLPQDFSLEASKAKLAYATDKLLFYKINKTNEDYVAFSTMTKKQVLTFAYLTRIVAMVNKIVEFVEKVNINDIIANEAEDDGKILTAELTTLKKVFTRNPTNLIALHFDVITDMLWNNDRSFKLINSLKFLCDNWKNKTKDIIVLNDNERIKAQICTKNYTVLYKLAEDVIFIQDYEKARESLISLVSVLQNKNDTNITDIFHFLNTREETVKSLKKSIQYAGDLKLPIYLKYLQNNLQHYNIILSFLTGDNWWANLRTLYSNGRIVNKFLDTAEEAFYIAEDVLTHLDKIHLVKLYHDIGMNKGAKFCKSNLTLTDYVPDASGALTMLRHQVCETPSIEIIREIPPLLFAAQGYIDELSLPTDVDYDSLSSDINKVETKVKMLENGPQEPQRPRWITNEKINGLRNVTLHLLSKESLTKISFGIISNLVDAGTLFLNSSQCSLCSKLTTWFKQINLQLYKKQEYDTLLCQLEHMSQEDIYNTLKNEFHWDMAIAELVSTRNYTKYELNKSLNVFLDQVKLHLIEDITANSTKISVCLTHNVTRNIFGNITLFIKVLAHTTKLLRSQVPHLQEINGMKKLPLLVQLYADVAHNLHVTDTLENYLNDTFGNDLMKLIQDKNLVLEIEQSRLDLLLIKDQSSPVDYLTLQKSSWEDVCLKYDCRKINDTISKNLKSDVLAVNLLKMQQKEFWNFTFISDIMYHLEMILNHAARLLGVASYLDMEGLMAGNISSILDTGVQMLMDDTLESFSYSILGLLKEVNVLLHNTTLKHDLTSITNGLSVMRELKNFVVKDDVKMRISTLFTDHERIESALNNIGINNTNFWSIAAPRIIAGQIRPKALLEQNTGVYHIKNFVCQAENMSAVMLPGNVDVVTLDDIYGAVIEQFCGISDDQAKETLTILIENLNYTLIFKEVKAELMSQLFRTSNLTKTEGDMVLEKFEDMTKMIPIVQSRISNVSDILAEEPLIMMLRNSGSIGNLVSGGDFLPMAGNLLCGKPFPSGISRFYKAIVQTPDLTDKHDKTQLDSLPTDFCRDVYKQITSMEGGKIVWSYAKPLLFGKILYTPKHPVVENIIQRANASFAPMFKLVNMIHSFAKVIPALDMLNDHRVGLIGLKDLLTAPQHAPLVEALVGNVSAPHIDIDKLFNGLGEIKDIENMLKKASDLLHCVNLNRFKLMPGEKELTQEAARLTRIKEFSAGLVFLNTDKEDVRTNNIEYKIRMDIENAPTTKRIRHYMWIPGPEASFLENMRYFRGFIQIQDLIDKAIIELSMKTTPRRNHKRDVSSVVTTSDWALYTQQTPYPCYRRDMFQTSMYESQALIVALYFSLLLTVSSAVRFIVSDKESGNTMLMSVMGVNLKYHTFSWFISSLVEMVLTVACMTAVLKLGNVLPRTDTSMIFVLFFMFGVSVISFCYMTSKLFSSASFAAVCSAIAFFCTFMPFIVILSLEAVISSFAKVLVSLWMSSSFCYAVLYITRYEATGTGSGWAQLWDTPVEGDDMCIAIAAIMLIVDTVLYLLIGLMFDYFLGIKTVSNITNCQAIGEKAGVSIVNITKVYGGSRPKMALDGVSMELQKGQITALLGHNGAGKTTLIKILNGMLEPTKGHVIVRSEDGSKSSLGVCPQKDVLFEYMTAEEHVALYAQLKSGLPLEKVQEEVDSMLQVLSLGKVSGEPVARLSGGTRRRLCVALAFVSRPHLVTLDEPTAGVDPAARRDIWAMIMKLRENRTILLTTHHLDEAELLSDQIVIMHKGQIHTTGSPIEIKRSMGTGYKLSVIYPDSNQHLLNVSDIHEEDCVEEKTKNLLAVSRSVIKNANLVDINGLEVEINLPFYDNDGISNDFLQLCSTLEQQQSFLQYASYNMECSSLEHVFYNICQQADAPQTNIENELSSKSASTSSIRHDQSPLVPADGPLKGSSWQQFCSLIHLRFLHYIRNRWLLFLVIVLPSIFVTLAMAFSNIRPPADNEVSLRIYPGMYEGRTDFLVRPPAAPATGTGAVFATNVLKTLQQEQDYRNWTIQDTPVCKCEDAIQKCQIETRHWNRPPMMVLPDATTANHWLEDSMKVYIMKRYGGYSAVIRDNTTNLVAWYNNKGLHAMPAFVNGLNNAILRSITGNMAANITVYTHPLKISKEQINKDTVYQHAADAGVTAMVLVGYCLVTAGASIYLVTTRNNQEKRLQLLCGVSPALYWTTALVWDMIIIVINMAITAVIMKLFNFPVFVAHNNLPAICILIIFYGYACNIFTHVTEKLFTDPSLANMILFCGNTFLGISGIALLLILDIISESDATDNARYILHKIFLVSPQFALADGLLEIARNTIQAQVLSQFGMETYQDPLTTNVIGYHLIALTAVGTLLFLINLAVEYDYFDALVNCCRPKVLKYEEFTAETEEEIRAESARVHGSLEPLRLRTIGNINAGYTGSKDDTIKTSSLKRWSAAPGAAIGGDAAACVGLSRVYHTRAGYRYAVHDLTLGIPRGQCTALLGENGAGKSTTFAMLTGQVRKTSGKIYLDNKKVTSRGLCQGLISYCPQQDAIDPLLTVNETLQFYCGLRGIENSKEVIKRTVEMFDLTKYTDVRNGTLSGGNKRKLCTAIAFMGRTQLVLLDEPTSGMDPGSRGGVWRGVCAAGAAGRASLLSTHALDDARRAAQRVALLRTSTLVALAPLDVCLKRFGGGYVCACRVGRGAALRTWRRVRARSATARLQLVHEAALHFLLPIHNTVDGKEVITKLSDVFRLLAELQANGDIEDYTVNQSSLDQMFLNNSNKCLLEEDGTDHEDTAHVIRRDHDEFDVVTAL